MATVYVEVRTFAWSEEDGPFPTMPTLDAKCIAFVNAGNAAVTYEAVAEVLDRAVARGLDKETKIVKPGRARGRRTAAEMGVVV
jgi:hypothetical protein